MQRSHRPARPLLRTLRQLFIISSLAALTACGDVGGTANQPSGESALSTTTTAVKTGGTGGGTGGVTSASTTEPASNPASNPASTPAAPASESAPSVPTEIGPIFVTFVSKSGSIRVELFPKEAPRTCANFLNLAKRRYY
ncbi:MAG: peptidylprolyl isomerase, partial [bacterium]